MYQWSSTEHHCMVLLLHCCLVPSCYFFPSALYQVLSWFSDLVQDLGKTISLDNNSYILPADLVEIHCYLLSYPEDFHSSFEKTQTPPNKYKQKQANKQRNNWKTQTTFVFQLRAFNSGNRKAVFCYNAILLLPNGILISLSKCKAISTLQRGKIGKKPSPYSFHT